MRTRIFNIVVAVFLGIAAVYVVLYLRDVELVFHDYTPDIVTIARELNVRNLVSTIYLGPRVYDTFLEVTVVILSVFGMKYVRGKR